MAGLAQFGEAEPLVVGIGAGQPLIGEQVDVEPERDETFGDIGQRALGDVAERQRQGVPSSGRRPNRR